MTERIQTEVYNINLTTTMPHFLYITQASKELTTCKIGITDNLDLNENSPTKVLLATQQNAENSPRLHSKSNSWEYLYTCEVKDLKSAQQMEKDIRNEPGHLREDGKLEVYFCNKELLEKYIDFIKSHKFFVQETFIKKKEEPTQETIIVKKTTARLKERGLTHKDVMDRAKRVKNDEFYTRYEDVEKELSMYDKKIWKNKTILCNCDDALEPGNRNNTSAFSQYFVDNFKQLKIKKLICIHYSGKVDLFNQGKKAYVYIRVYDGHQFQDYKDCPNGFDGSFDHPFSLQILNEEADIVCTNPPFSRSIDYWKIVIESGKKFIIIANVTNAINTAYIHYFKNKQVWAGYNRVYWYLTPKRELTRSGGSWFTNIPIKERSQYKLLKIIPTKKIPEDCKEYDDTKTLIVKEGYIPSDYKKPFAVSVNPIMNGLLEKGYEIVQEKRYTPYIDGKEQYAKVLVQLQSNISGAEQEKQ